MSMHTQHGERRQNAAIDIDFEKQTIDFRTVGNVTIADSLLDVYFSLILLVFCLGLPVSFLIEYLSPKAGDWLMYVTIYAILLQSLGNLAKVLTPKWQEKILPKKPTWGAIGKKKLKTWYKVNPQAIINKQLVLNDEFSNVLLEYKMNGDYKKYLSHICIRETFLDKTYQRQWIAIFKFKHTPKDGELWMRWY